MERLAPPVLVKAGYKIVVFVDLETQQRKQQQLTASADGSTRNEMHASRISQASTKIADAADMGSQL